MTTTSQRLLKTMLTMTSNQHHYADDQYRSAQPARPTNPTPTDTCHVFDEAAGSVVSTPC